eukprot:353758-Chlamydomonas_euryale.AAC.1
MGFANERSKGGNKRLSHRCGSDGFVYVKDQKGKRTNPPGHPSRPIPPIQPPGHPSRPIPPHITQSLARSVSSTPHQHNTSQHTTQHNTTPPSPIPSQPLFRKPAVTWPPRPSPCHPSRRPAGLTPCSPITPQADWLLLSSREDLLCDEAWNQQLRAAVPAAYLAALEEYKALASKAPSKEAPTKQAPIKQAAPTASAGSAAAQAVAAAAGAAEAGAARAATVAAAAATAAAAVQSGPLPAEAVSAAGADADGGRAAANAASPADVAAVATAASASVATAAAASAATAFEAADRAAAATAGVALRGRDRAAWLLQWLPPVGAAATSLPAFFRPVARGVAAAMRGAECVPVVGGGWAVPGGVLLAPREMLALVPPNDLYRLARLRYACPKLLEVWEGRDSGGSGGSGGGATAALQALGVQHLSAALLVHLLCVEHAQQQQQQQQQQQLLLRKGTVVGASAAACEATGVCALRDAAGESAVMASTVAGPTPGQSTVCEAIGKSTFGGGAQEPLTGDSAAGVASHERCWRLLALLERLLADEERSHARAPEAALLGRHAHGSATASAVLRSLRGVPLLPLRGGAVAALGDAAFLPLDFHDEVADVAHALLGVAEADAGAAAEAVDAGGVAFAADQSLANSRRSGGAAGPVAAAMQAQGGGVGIGGGGGGGGAERCLGQLDGGRAGGPPPPLSASFGFEDELRLVDTASLLRAMATDAGVRAAADLVLRLPSVRPARPADVIALH